MLEDLSARTRAAWKHGAEGAARLRGEWLAAGREAYHNAIREGRQVAAQSELQIEALGRESMAKAAKLKAHARSGIEAMQTDQGGVKDRAVGATRRLATEVRRPGSTTGKVLSDMGAHFAAGREMEREVIGAATADIYGKAWGSPNTLLGLLYGGVGHAAGVAKGDKPYVVLEDNAVQFRNNPFGGSGAITLGNTTTYAGDPVDPNDAWAHFAAKHGVPVQEHERQHTIQAQQLGPFYLPSNLLGGAVAVARGEDWHGWSNWNERGPQETPPRPWPWPRRPGQ